MRIYNHINEGKNKNIKQFAVLVDPDNISETECIHLAIEAEKAKVDLFFVGGSLIAGNGLHSTIKTLKANCKIPIIIFPGNNLHIDAEADGILFLSLISGRNPEHLIGQHVLAAPILKRTKLEILPTGYILIDGGAPTTVSYISNTTPIPADKPTIAACTAMAGELLGLKLIYLDAGSGAKQHINRKLISTVRRAVDAPIIIGGGIDNEYKAQEIYEAGADILVIGNGIEKDFELMIKVAQLKERLNNEK